MKTINILLNSKMTMKRLSTCILLLTMAICASGQTLTGKVTDEQQQPLSYANVVFLSLPDSAFVA